MPHPITLAPADIFTPQALWDAYLCARRGKRDRWHIMDFALSAAARLSDLRAAILEGSYRPQPCRVFTIYCHCGHKNRIIRAPAFADLIVQFALYRALYPLISPSLITDSCGCRPGLGTHRAADRVQEFMRRSGTHCLQMDIRRYYYSMRHPILRRQLSRWVQDARVLDLLMMCAGDDDPGVGVGSLMAQFFGMIYLNDLDQHCKRGLGIRQYVRYVDDIVIIDTPDRLHEWLTDITAFLHERLDLSLSRYSIRPLREGIDFCGYITYRERRRVRPAARTRFRQLLREGRWQGLQSCAAHALHTASLERYQRALDKRLGH